MKADYVTCAHLFPAFISAVKKEFFMFGHGKESYRLPPRKHSLTHRIESNGNEGQSRDDCDVTKSYPVLDRCENFTDKKMPVIRNGLPQSVFVFPGTPLYHSLVQEIPEAFIAKKQENG
jgi:hypothetical protein